MQDKLNRSEFISRYGSVYEHSPWVAEKVFDLNPDLSAIDRGELIGRFEHVFLTSADSRKLEVLRAHPELACKRADAKQLTDASRREQSGAGLDQCNATELAMFAELNSAYRSKFDFPFIIAVRGRGRVEILECMKSRLENDRESEFATALKQVCQIAGFRITDIARD